jgi:thiol:disulfide interchange protein DsbA
MNRILLISLLFAAGLVACSQEPAEPMQSQSTLQQNETVPDVPANEGSEQSVTDEDDAPLELVEESAAEPDEQTSEQPILLAQASTSAANQDWRFKDGQHFNRLMPTQPTVGGADKVEVAEFFWYGCAHCYTFEPYINRWAAGIPANVRFVRIPATWNPLVKLHAQLYYTEEVLVQNGKIEDPEGFRSAVFREYHERANRLTSMESIGAIFTRFGVNSEDFESTWSSFEVDQKLRLAQDLARRYAITGVPAIVVNGKYRTGAAEAGGYPTLLEVINELVARETVR